MKVTVRCFASVRELFGTDCLELDVDDGATVADVRTELARQRQEFARLPVAIAVNLAYADDDRVLVDGDELAFIPPISGGSGGAEPPPATGFVLQREPLDPRALEDEVRSDADGAVVAFSGVTRDHNDGAAVRGLAYEAYDEMARAVVDRLLTEAAARFEIGRVRVAHRLGDVPIGEASIVVAVAAPHRGPAFDAARWIMDRVKAEVPIFKREELADGDGSRWVGDLPRP